MSGAEPRFLTIEDVLLIHRIAIEDQGGDPSIRDRGLLESALAAPRQKFGGQFAHSSVPAMAAAYAFHISGNHPFIDGNKRAAFGALVAFLIENGWSLDADSEESERMILDLAAGNATKAHFTDWVFRNSHEKPSLELRDFLSRVRLEDLITFADSVVAGSRPTEVDQSTKEAARAIPMIDQLERTASELSRTGDKDNDAKTQALLYCSAILVSIYRLAEDMGYEW